MKTDQRIASCFRQTCRELRGEPGHRAGCWPARCGLQSAEHTTTLALAKWLQSHLQAGAQIVIPEIADYEVRRELLRGKMSRSVAQLDQLAAKLNYLPLTTAAVRRAADFWAQARQQGTPTASDPHLDCDVILAAQAADLADPNVIVATTNVAHIARYVAADHWQNIQP